MIKSVKKTILFLCVLILFFGCKNNGDDPKPTVNPFGNSNGISYNGTTTSLTTKAYNYNTGNSYSIIGTENSGTTITAWFSKGGQPTQNSTENLSTSQTLQLIYKSSAMQLSSSGGTANIIVDDTSITVNFTDATFTNTSGDMLKISGQLIVNKQTLSPISSGFIKQTNLSYTYETLIQTQNLSGGVYNITGKYSTISKISINFNSGKPTTSSIENLATSTKVSMTLYNNVGLTFPFTSGHVIISVVGTSVSVYFSDASISSQYSSSPIPFIGQLYTSN